LAPGARVVVFVALNVALRVWLPTRSAVHVPWLLPAVEALLLVVLLAADPQGIAKRARRLHRVAVTLVLLVIAALWSTVLLVYDLIEGIGVSEEPTELLATGAFVWFGNNLSFALLYWLIDSGGPMARARQPAPVDFAFTQHMSPKLRRPAGGRSFWTTCTSASRMRRHSARPT
jgi:hypothetical protein